MEYKVIKYCKKLLHASPEKKDLYVYKLKYHLNKIQIGGTTEIEKALSAIKKLTDEYNVAKTNLDKINPKDKLKRAASTVIVNAKKLLLDKAIELLTGLCKNNATFPGCSTVRTH